MSRAEPSRGGEGNVRFYICVDDYPFNYTLENGQIDQWYTCILLQ